MNATTAATYPKRDAISSVPATVIYLAYLDGLRALAALYVLVHHAVLQIDVESSTSTALHLLASVFAHGRYAVDLFIVLSGFCLMLPVVNNNGILRSGSLIFLKRRAKRILPTYYLAMGLSLLLVFSIIGKKTGSNWDSSLPVTQWSVITHLLLIQDLFTDTIFKINHVFWSISVEFHIYLFFPLLVLSWKKWGSTLTTMGSIVISLALWYLLARTPLNVYGMSPHYITLFVFGMLATHLSFTKIEYWKIILIAGCAISAMAIHPIIRDDLIVGMGSAAVLVLIASGKLPALRYILSWQPLVFIGTFAYSIYLIHAPLLQVLSQYVIAPLGLSPLLAIGFFIIVGVPLILGGAYLFFLVAERPFIRR